MSINDFRRIGDHQRGVNRKKVYGSDRAYFPLPNKAPSIRFVTPKTKQT